MMKRVLRCATCRKSQPATLVYFYHHRTRRNRLAPTCRACRRADALERYYANPAKTIERNRRWRREHPELHRRQWRRAYRRKWQQRQAYYRAWYERNRERRLAQIRAYAKDHPEVGRLAVKRRRDRLRGGGVYSTQDIRALYVSQGGHCYYCEAFIGTSYEIDHKIPVSHGGRNDVANLVLACRYCNARKGTRSVIAFLAEVA